MLHVNKSARMRPEGPELGNLEDNTCPEQSVICQYWHQQTLKNRTESITEKAWSEQV